MKKRKIRCYTAYVEANGIYNNEVFYLAQEGWSNLSLFTCINCSELFVIDRENPNINKLSIQEIGDKHICPKCNSKLEDTLREYPKKFRTRNGEISSFIPSNNIPPDEESRIIEVWELLP